MVHLLTSPEKGGFRLSSLAGLFSFFPEQLWVWGLAQTGYGVLNVLWDLNKVLWCGLETGHRVLNLVRDDDEHLVLAAWSLWGQGGSRGSGDDDGGDRSAFAAEALVRLFAEETGLCERTTLCGCAASCGLTWCGGWCGDEHGLVREVVGEYEGFWSGDAALEDAHALGLARDDRVPFDNGPSGGGPDGLVRGGRGAAGTEDEFDGVDGEKEGGDPRDYCEEDGFAAGAVDGASKRGGGCGKGNSSHCLEADDKQEEGDFYNDRAAFVVDLTLHADGLECASGQKECKGYEVRGNEELEDRGLEGGHESLSS